MLIQTGENQTCGGPLDFICILKSNKTGRFHPAFVEEKPMPGPIPDVADTKFVRVKSKMHHTAGFETFEEAVTNVQESMRPRLTLSDDNVALEHSVDWDEKQMIFTMILLNWRACGKTLNEVLQS